MTVERLEPASVAEPTYARLRALILDGDVEAGARLGQVELAETLGVSRTPVREALRRLTGEGLVVELTNRGFRVADLGLDAVMRRLEVRLLLEPGIARLAAERATAEDRAALEALLETEAHADSSTRHPDEAHDASRAFHILLARSTGNPELVSLLEGLWIVEVGRRLLARRLAEPDWLLSDVAEHRAILGAVAARDPDAAERLMREHVGGALVHWREEQ